MTELDCLTLQACNLVAQNRRQLLQEQINARRQRAWQVSHLAAAILKGEFQVTHVVAFGSLVQAGQFHQHSDVELAVRNLQQRDVVRAVSRLQSLDPAISVNLILFEGAQPTLQTAIQRDGVAL